MLTVTVLSLSKPAASKYTCQSKTALNCNTLILLFVIVKIVLNLLAIAHFGFQRDELLYLVLGDHLAWGYKEVPPLIALLAKIITTFFGNSLFAARTFSTIFCGLIIWFTGQIVVEFGGGKYAIILTNLALIFSPAFAASGYLFEPVVFDQFWWVLCVWMLIKYINTSLIKYLYFFGVAIGIGLLTKYSMAFFAISLMLGLLIFDRKILNIRHILVVILIAILIFLPNMIWELKHHLPVFRQLNELRSTQLDSITPFDFIVQQLLVNGIALFLWLSGLFFLFIDSTLRRFRFLAAAFIFIFIFLLVMSGKNYYILGAYPMLFAAGAYGIEKWLKKKALPMRVTLLLFISVPNLIILPLVLPLFSLNQTMDVFKFACRKLPFLVFEAKWDDNKIHSLTQNYGDMLGWDEMTEKVAIAYRGLTLDQQQHTQIYADNYGEASSLHLYGKQYCLPEPICLNSSFVLWAPSKIDADFIIYVDEKGGKNVKKIGPDLESYSKLSEVTNPLSIEKGTGIFLLIHPKQSFYNNYKRVLAQKNPNNF